MFIVRLFPRNFVIWTVTLLLTLTIFFTYRLASMSMLPFGWNVPAVPFIACGTASTAQQQPLPPTAKDAAYQVGADLHTFKETAGDAKKVFGALMAVAKWTGKMVGWVLNGSDGEQAPAPKRGTPQAPPRFRFGSDGGCGAPCPGAKPDVLLAAQAARAAGFTGHDLVTAIAVAGAESGYRPKAANTHSSARGLWQIMQSVHRDKLVGRWSNPFDSATVAHRVWRSAGRSWRPWVGYTSGAYRSHLPEAQRVATCTDVASFTGRAGAVIREAQSYLGVPYVFGGTSRAGIDCSGLVLRAYAAAGVSLPRVSWAQMAAGVPVSMAALQPGDLVGWDNSVRNAGVDHVAIYVGGGRIIEAAHPGTTVRVRRLSPLEGGVARRILT